jgi:hypothetical protein
LSDVQARPLPAPKSRMLEDIPIALASELQPASIDVANSLAEDTVFATGIRPDAGEQKMALFANQAGDPSSEELKRLGTAR